MTSRRDLVIWAAGFFDGEGSVQIARVNQEGRANTRTVNFRLFISASQVEKDPLEVLMALWDGCIVTSHPEAGNCRACYAWQAVSQVAAKALTEMKPYLKVKDLQAELALSFQAVRKKGKTTLRQRTERFERDEETYTTMRMLNRRGVVTVN